MAGLAAQTPNYRAQKLITVRSRFGAEHGQEFPHAGRSERAPSEYINEVLLKTYRI